MNGKALFLGTITTSMILAAASSSGTITTFNNRYNKVSYISSSSSDEYSSTGSSYMINNENGNPIKKTGVGIISVAKDMFGDMRDLTSEEEEACYNALYNMSEDTGVRLF